jgi:CRISPR/Cas system endoribonuclease Cas6 (RAMP superfamily)
MKGALQFSEPCTTTRNKFATTCPSICRIQNAQEQYAKEEDALESSFQDQLKNVEVSMSEKWEHMVEQYNAFAQVSDFSYHGAEANSVWQVQPFARMQHQI